MASKGRLRRSIFELVLDRYPPLPLYDVDLVRRHHESDVPTVERPTKVGIQSSLGGNSFELPQPKPHRR